MRGRALIAELRAAAWARRALRQVRRRLAAGQLAHITVPAPPPLPAAGTRGVDAALDACHPSCLERAIVRQAWLAARGVHRDVVIGVTAPAEGFVAHAWLEGEAGGSSGPFSELTRLPG